MNRKCRKVRELILTDYIDGQMAKRQETFIKLHMAGCDDCVQFFEDIKKSVIEPFASTEKVSPPQYVWERIKENIIIEERKKSPLRNLFRWITDIHYAPMPVFSFVTAMLLIVVVGVTIQSQFTINDSSKQTNQNEYFSYSLETSGGVLNDNGANFGTNIEKYFL